MNKFRTWAYWKDEWIKPVLYALLIALVIRTFIAQPFKIPSSSMEPTLMPGDRIFVNKFIYGARIPLTSIRLPKLRAPVMGDIIVFRSPVEENKFLVKRLIGLPGDTIEIKNGHIIVNGKIQDSPSSFRNFTYYNRGEYGKAGRPIKVPENSLFVLGDNSSNSVDSRYWGFVPYDNLAGKVFLIHWPLRRLKVIK